MIGTLKLWRAAATFLAAFDGLALPPTIGPADIIERDVANAID